MKTMKQIANEIGVDKQRVYRFIKQNRITEALHHNGVKYFNEADETLIKQHFFERTTSHDALQTASTASHTASIPLHEALQIEELHNQIKNENERLNAQLIAKDALIAQQQQSIQDLTSALLISQQTAQAAQALHAGTIQAQLADGGAASGKREGFFSRIFGGGKPKHSEEGETY